MNKFMGKKQIVAYLLTMVLVVTTVVGVFPSLRAKAATPKYLVLIEDSKGVWRGYKNLAYKASNKGIYVYAKDIAGKLGYTYKGVGKDKFRISKNKNTYLQFQKGSKNYIYYKMNKSKKQTTTYVPQLYSKKYAIYAKTLSSLCFYSYKSASSIQDDTYKKAGYEGVVCYSLKRKVVQAPNAFDVANAKSLGLETNQGGNPGNPGTSDEQKKKEAAVIESVVKGSSYTTLTNTQGTSFTDGQDATLALSSYGFDATAGAKVLNHPNGIASDGKHFYICDTWNNRVLCYNSLPNTGSTPDFVLGQTSLNSAAAGYGLENMNWPVGVATDGKRLYVADAHNNRILVWNNLPTKSGQKADWQINMIDKSANSPLERELNWPWAVWTDGKKLIVTATVGGKVLVWNQLPNSSQDEPDFILKTGGTPRSIVTDGKSYLIIGDHNIQIGNKNEPGTRVWTSFPTSANQKQDFVISGTNKGGCQLSDGRIALLGDNAVSIYNGKPTGTNWKPSLSIGGGSTDKDDDDLYYCFRGGDYNQVLEVGGRLYVSCYNGNKIVGYKKIPTKRTDMPDIVIGAANKDEEVLLNHNIYQNLNPVTDGKRLIAADDFNGYLVIWNTLPGQSKAEPSYALKLYRFYPWDLDLHNGKLVIAGKGYEGGKLAIWNSVPTSKKAPDYYFDGTLGSIKIQDLVGVAMDDTYLYVSDQILNKTYIFKGIPSKNSSPVYTLNHSGVLNVNNGKLTIADGSAWIYDVNQLAQGDGKAIHITEAYVSTLNQNQKMIKEKVALTQVNEVLVGDKGELILSEMNYNQVLYWDSLEDAVAKKQGITLGFSEDNYTNKQIGVESNHTSIVVHPSKSTMYMPKGLAYDGTNLWVGEFKFSSRLLLFQKK